MEERFNEDQLDTVRGVINRLREAAEDMAVCLNTKDYDDLEAAIDEAQYMLSSAAKVLKEML